MLPAGYEKRSFLQFALPINSEALVEEYHSIPEESWASSYWGNVHCSVGMLLLRGGNAGSSEDFFSEDTVDSPLLAGLPIMSGLLSADGPFGDVDYAFLFRMEPDGVTLRHRDLMEQWRDLYRVHIPIITNPGAFLVSNNRSLHFAVGSAWSFDNFADHGVVNGPEERVHLIFDVRFSDRFAAMLDDATFIKGKEDIEHVKRISDKAAARQSYPGDKAIREAIDQLQERGMDNDGIADFLNSKQLPTKQYATTGWSAEMIHDFLQS